jgi:predicted RNA-binding Zn-ribbon protein involved in translation (DUF1610 family)
MRRFPHILARTAGSSVGLLVGGVSMVLLLYWPAALLSLFVSGGSDDGLGLWILIVGVGVLAGASIGAALGATRAQTSLRRKKSPFRIALLGAAVGMVIGVPCALLARVHVSIVPILIVAGAVIGSGWGAKPGGEPGPCFIRQGNDTNCKKCGFELIGPGGPCRRCNDVHTRPCASCGRYILPNDKTCPYCGAAVK